MMDYPKPDKPVQIALVGTGNRSKGIYQPLLSALSEWVEVVACVDPVRENCDYAAEAFGAHAYYDVREMVKDGIAEAALVVTPVPSHYAYSVYLSDHGIHNQSETTWCSLLAQAREMIRVALPVVNCPYILAAEMPMPCCPRDILSRWNFEP